MRIWRYHTTSRYTGHMSKRQVLMILGVWVMIFLFLGLPAVWDKLLSLGVGLVIILIALSFKPPMRTVPTDRIPYVEHKSAPKPESRPVAQAPMNDGSAPAPISSPDSPMTS